MDQITKTVNQILAFVVGVGLICVSTFILLMASAQLNNSPVGDLLARLAGETARTARTDSLAYWGRVGSEVVTGFGIGLSEVSSGGTINTSTGTVATPVVIPTAVVRATQPVVGGGGFPVQSTPQSEAALLLWRGVDVNGHVLPLGVSLENVQVRTREALERNSGDALAKWLWNKVSACVPAYNTLVQSDYTNLSKGSDIQAAAQSVIQNCNPRVLHAYVRSRWAQLYAVGAQPAATDTQAVELLAGVFIRIDDKATGAARGDQLADLVRITVQGIEEFQLGPIPMTVSVAALNQLLPNGWQLNSVAVRVPGELTPSNPPEPVTPTAEELGVITTEPTPTTPAMSGDQPVTGLQGNIYTVQARDTIYGIARALGVLPQDIIAANPTINPDFIYPGQQLIIPDP